MGGDDRIFGSATVRSQLFGDVRTVSGTPNIIGGDDTIYGGGDLIVLGNGNVFVRAGLGANTYYTGAGTGTITYFDSVGGVRVDLKTNAAFGGDASGDRIAYFERLNGSATAGDVIKGTDGGNITKGFGGNDFLASRDGTDRLLGNGGADTSNLIEVTIRTSSRISRTMPIRLRSVAMDPVTTPCRAQVRSAAMLFSTSEVATH